PGHDLLSEARASYALAHPNICIIYEVGETGGDLYIVMELVEGRSLREMCSTTGIAPETVLRYGAQIAAALARAHDRGIAHRDPNPQTSSSRRKVSSKSSTSVSPGSWNVVVPKSQPAPCPLRR